MKLVFDVESIGLHGEGFAVGWVVVTDAGREVASGFLGCNPDNAKGDDDDRAWITENVLPHLPELSYDTPVAIRLGFWYMMKSWKVEYPDLQIYADCAWPVEARFLIDCVNDNKQERKWEGPYPLHDIASVFLAKGIDPLGTFPRLASELPAHNPLNDARQSARILTHALRTVGNVANNPDDCFLDLDIERRVAHAISP